MMSTRPTVRPQDQTLATARIGLPVVIVGFDSAHEPKEIARLCEMGFCPGAEVCVLDNSECMRVKLGLSTGSMAIRRQLAEKIKVV